MKVTVFRFTAKQLQSIHSDHLGFIVASSHCCNELICVMPYIIFEQDIKKANETEEALINIRFFAILRHQIAKIFEYRDLCNNYIAKIRTTFPAAATRLQNESKQISRSIKAAKWAETVRNKVVSHFDEAYALNAVKSMPEDTELTFIVGNLHGLTAFDFADRAIVRAMFVDAGVGDEEAGKTAVLRWSVDLQKQITTFHAGLVKNIFHQHGIFQNKDMVEIRDQWCAAPGSIAIPLSTLKP
ncbi:MAG TPA: hypothetical protein VIJ52_02450 [Pseudolabrys sp.]